MTTQRFRLSREWIAVLAVLGAALLYKLIYLVYYSQQMPYYNFPMGDSIVYLDWARNIIQGDVLSLAPALRVFYRAPLYPYVLAALIWVFNSLLPVYVLQILLGVLNLFLAYLIAKRLFSHRAGIAATAIAALYAPLSFKETKLVSVTIVITLLLVTVWLLLRSEERRPRLHWLLAGLCIGVGTLAWGGTIVIVPVLFLFWLFLRKRFRFVCFALFAAGWFVAILPATLHNVLAGNDFVLVNANSGYTFYQGNNPGASGTIVHPPEVYEQTYGGKYPTGIGEQQFFDMGYAARTMQRDSIKPSEASSFWLKRGLSWIAKNPGNFLRLEFQKLVLMLSNYEFASNYFLSVELEQVPVLRIAFLPFALLFALGLAGLILELRSRAKLWPLYLVLVATGLTLMVFYVGTRYRLPLILPLAVFGGATISRLIDHWKNKKPGIVELGLVVLFAILSWIFCTVPMSSRHAFVTALGYRNLGECYHQQVGNAAKARRAFDRAISLHEQHNWFGRTVLARDAQADVFTLRGDLSFDEGKFDSAIADFRRSLEIDPSRTQAVGKLGFAYFNKATRVPGIESAVRAALLDTALTFAQDWYRTDTTNFQALALIGDVHLNQRDTTKAMESYARLVTVAPRFAPAYYAMSDIYLARNDPGQAIATVKMLTTADTLNVPAFLILGDLYLRTADSSAALENYERAARLDTLNLQAAIKLGAFYSAKKNYGEAARIFEAAIKRVERPGVRLIPGTPAVAAYVELKLRLASAFLNLAEWDKAKTQAEAVLKLVPGQQTAQQLKQAAEEKKVPAFILW